MALLHGGIVVTLFTCVVLIYMLVLPVYMKKNEVLTAGFILAAWVAHRVTNWLGYPFGGGPR